MEQPTRITVIVRAYIAKLDNEDMTFSEQQFTFEVNGTVTPTRLHEELGSRVIWGPSQHPVFIGLDRNTGLATEMENNVDLKDYLVSWSGANDIRLDVKIQMKPECSDTVDKSPDPSASTDATRAELKSSYIMSSSDPKQTTVLPSSSPGQMFDEDRKVKRPHTDKADDDISDVKKARVAGASSESSGGSGHQMVDGGRKEKRPHTDKANDDISDVKKARVASDGASVDGSGGSGEQGDVHAFGFYSQIRIPSKDKDEYILVEDRDPKIVLSEIERLLTSTTSNILKGNGYSYTVPLRSRKMVVYHPVYGLVHKRGKSVTYEFSKNMDKVLAFTCVLSVIVESIRGGKKVTSRHVFYRYKDVFGSQAVSDGILDHVCCMFGCTRLSLNVIPEPKGSIAGPLILILRNQSRLSCSELNGIRIPSTLSEIEGFQHHAKFILLLEKHSTFYHLIQMKFHTNEECILITGKGVPDIATRAFLRKLHDVTELPIHAFMDPDPYGVHILFVYAFGSLKMSYANVGLVVPAINWLGLFIEDARVQDKMVVDKAYYSVITQSEAKMLKNLLGHKNLILPLNWSNQIQKISLMKSSIEALFSVGLSYLSEEVLPSLLNLKSKSDEDIGRRQRASQMFFSADDWLERMWFNS